MVGNPKLEAVVLPFALLFGGIAQLLAGMWEFKKNNTFGAVAFTSYGAFWISFFSYIKYVAATLPPADAHTATGIFLLTWTIPAIDQPTDSRVPLPTGGSSMIVPLTTCDFLDRAEAVYGQRIAVVDEPGTADSLAP